LISCTAARKPIGWRMMVDVRCRAQVGGRVHTRDRHRSPRLSPGWPRQTGPAAAQKKNAHAAHTNRSEARARMGGNSHCNGRGTCGEKARADGMRSTAASNKVVYNQRPPLLLYGTSTPPPSPPSPPPPAPSSSPPPAPPSPPPPPPPPPWLRPSTSSVLGRLSLFAFRMRHHLVIFPPPKVTTLRPRHNTRPSADKFPFTGNKKELNNNKNTNKIIKNN
jgi:hypothetical protein